MKKKITSLFLALTMVFSLCVSASAAEPRAAVPGEGTILLPLASMSISGTIAPGASIRYANPIFIDGSETMICTATWSLPGNLIRVEFIPCSGEPTLGYTFEKGGKISEFELSLNNLEKGDYYISVKALESNTSNTTVVFQFEFT